MHCHHSLLHLAVGEIANITNDLVPVAKIQKRNSVQTLLPLSESLQSLMFTPTEVPRTFDVFPAG